MASAMFQARMKSYFNTPEVIARIGKWRNDTLARVGAYSRGIFRNKLARPQKSQKVERTVRVTATITDAKSGKLMAFNEELFVPRVGPIVIIKNGRLAPKTAALIALDIVSKRVKGQGAGKPPRMGPTKKLRQYNDFALDSASESVVVGTVPFPKKNPTPAASVPNLLDEGNMQAWVANNLLPAGGVYTTYSTHPYVESILPPATAKLMQLIERRPVA